MLTYPIPDVALPLKTVKVPPPTLINLMSAEFIHPNITTLLSELSFTDPHAIQYYPHVDTLAQRVLKLMNIPLERATFSAGSDLIISILIEALGTLTGKIILQSPNYPAWRNYAVLRKMDITLVTFGQSKPHTHCLSDFIQHMESSEPSLVVISNPNSPTGFSFSSEEILTLAAICSKYGHLLLIDACFQGFSSLEYDNDILFNEHIILIQSFSKSFGIAGARIALTTASEKITQYLSLWRPDFTVSGHAFQILEHLMHFRYRVTQTCQDIVLVREKFILDIKKIKPLWKALPSTANFVVFYLGEHENPTCVTEHLAKHGFRIADLSFAPGLKNCIRITIAHQALMDDVLNALKMMNSSSY